MIWQKITIETTNDATDIVAQVLFDNGIVGAEIEDTLNLSIEELKKMYVDIPIIKENTGIAFVSFYISINEDKSNQNSIKNINAVVSDTADKSYIASTDNIFTKEEFDKIFCNIKDDLNEYKNFMDMGSLHISFSYLDDKIFLNKWKENFKSFDIDDISIVPSWDKGSINNDKLNIYIEPGSAFGTGQHATTKLCIRNIKKVIDEKKKNLGESTLIDIGCGSGILAIVAKKLGIKDVLAVDIDNTVIENLAENICLNFTDKKFSPDKLVTEEEIIECKKYIDFDFGNIIDDDVFRDKIKERKYDIVVANILAPIIISLIAKADIYDIINDGGYFICSGIIEEKADEVRNALISCGHFTDIVETKEGNWVSFKALKI